MAAKYSSSLFKPMYMTCVKQARHGLNNFNYSWNRISYELLQPDDIPEAIECIGKEFTRLVGGEPMSCRLKSTTDDFNSTLSNYSGILAKDQLTFTAKDNLNGKIVGTLLSWDLYSEKHLNVPKLTATDPLFPLFDLLTLLEMRHYGKTHTDKYKEYFHQFFGGVDGEYKSQNILGNLAMLSNLKAKSDGYRGVYVEPTDPITQNIFLRKLGYRELGRISYDDYSHPLTQEKIFSGAYLDFPCKNSESNKNAHETVFSDSEEKKGNNFDCLICFKDLATPRFDELIDNHFQQ